MECPRCGEPLESYTLQDRQATVCHQCGWVGASTSLAGDDEQKDSESWEDALTRATKRWGSADTSHESSSPDETTDEITDDEEDSEPSDTEDTDAAGLRVIDEMDATDREQLHAVGIRTVTDLANADPRDIAEQTEIAEPDARAYVRTASIHFVTDGTREK